MPDKVEAITKLAQPTTTKELQVFMGMVNFYRRFIPKAAQTMLPLSEALKSKTLTWDKSMIEAFQATKAALARATILAHPQPNTPISITTDASDMAVGAVLQQEVDGKLVPLAFFSNKLRAPERKYSTFDRELLALYLGIRHFRYFLEGRQFVAYTDHKPLTFSMSKVSEPWSNRQQRHLTYISEFTTDIRHIQGKDNPVADLLSRATLANIQLGIDYNAMAPQKQDPEIQAYHTASSSLKLEDIPFGADGTTLLCDTSTGVARPIVPADWRRRVFDVIHNLSHPSIRSTRKLISEKFVWNGLQKQVGAWAKQCIPCQASKVHTHIKAPLEKFSVPQRRFDYIHVDLVGPLPPSNGYTHLLTVVDRFSIWAEVIPLNDTTAFSCAHALILNWIARFGVPLDITSDRGSQQLWSDISQFLGTKHHRTTAYHPQANGLVERFHRHLKSALRARLTGPRWIYELPWVLLGIRTSPKEDIGCSSAELVYGAPLTVPGQFLPRHGASTDIHTHLHDLQDQVRCLVPIPTTQHIQQTKFVFIRRDAHKTPLQRPYEGPFKVITPGIKTFTVDVGGRSTTVSVDRLKVAHINPDEPAQLAEPKRRGRPRNTLSDQLDKHTTDPSQAPTRPKNINSGRAVNLPQRYRS